MMTTQNTSYAIELCYESGEKKYVELAAKTDSQAAKAMREYIKTSAVELQDVNAFLSFSRPSDGQHGYINQDGAAPTGKTWN